MGFFKKGRSMKYKNKDGIELSYTGNDSHQVLVNKYGLPKGHGWMSKDN